MRLQYSTNEIDWYDCVNDEKAQFDSAVYRVLKPDGTVWLSWICDDYEEAFRLVQRARRVTANRY